jgi:hypothetical protein
VSIAGLGSLWVDPESGPTDLGGVVDTLGFLSRINRFRCPQHLILVTGVHLSSLWIIFLIEIQVPRISLHASNFGIGNDIN